jgi:hypothetical protein
MLTAKRYKPPQIYTEVIFDYWRGLGLSRYSVGILVIKLAELEIQTGLAPGPDAVAAVLAYWDRAKISREQIGSLIDALGRMESFANGVEIYENQEEA